MDPQYPRRPLNKKLIYPMIAIVIGITGYFVFSLLNATSSIPFAQVQPTRTALVVIPKGSSQQSQPIHLVPQNITVIIGLNNTVVWRNEDDVAVNIESGSNYVDPVSGNFSSSAQLPDGTILPGKTFDFTFTQPGRYHYYGIPGPWVQGNVVVRSY